MEKKIKELILEYVEFDGEIGEETNFKTDLGMTSFDMACFSADLQENFGVNVSAKDLRGCNTFGKLTKLLRERTSGVGSPVTA